MSVCYVPIAKPISHCVCSAHYPLLIARYPLLFTYRNANVLTLTHCELEKLDQDSFEESL